MGPFGREDHSVGGPTNPPQYSANSTTPLIDTSGSSSGSWHNLVNSVSSQDYAAAMRNLSKNPPNFNLPGSESSSPEVIGYNILADRNVTAVQVSDRLDMQVRAGMDEVTASQLASQGNGFKGVVVTDARTPMSRAAPELANATTLAGVSMVPYIGEAADAMVLLDPNSSWPERGVALGSLTLNLLAGGLLPNYGALRYGTRVDNVVDAAPNPGMIRVSESVGEVAPSSGGARCVRSADPTVANSTRAWRVGDPINNLTSRGRVPSWDAVRQRYWKNEAFYRSGEYSSAELVRMRQGLAPQRLNFRTGKLESIHLHHDPPQSAGGLFDFEPLWPEAHRQIHRGGGS